jgi:shikimate dehydrogenase
MSLNITATSRLYALFADPAIHSASPAMYNACFESLGIDAVYLAFTIGKGKIGKAMEAMRILPISGSNLSMPNKECVIPYLDYVSDDAKLAGAVNTVVNKDGELYGYNTDIGGSVSALKYMGADIEEKKAVIIGLGGAGRAILAGLAKKKAGEIAVFVRQRRIEEHKAFAHSVGEKTGISIKVLDIGDRELMTDKIQKSDILINATDIGMRKEAGRESKSLPIADLSSLHRNLFVMDAVYMPEETPLIKVAKKAGCKGVINGRPMLFFQGREAFCLFTGREMPADIVMKAWGDMK